MTDVIYSLSISRDIEASTPTYNQVGKYLENFTYRKRVTRETQLSFLSFEKVNKTNLVGHLNLNRFKYKNSLQKRTESSTIRSKSRYILITNQSIIKNGYTVGLFHGMKINGSYLGYESDLKEVDIKYDRTTNTVWTNTPSEWDPVNERFTGINILVKEGEEVKTYLFNSHPIFREATIEDIDPETSLFYEDRMIYTVEYDAFNDSYIYTIVNGSGPWFYKEQAGSTIELKNDGMQDAQEPWFPSYTLGEVRRVIDGSTYFYSTGEMDLLVYNPRFPFQAQKESAKIIGPNLIKLDRNNIVIRPEQRLNIDLIVFNNLGNLKFALTSDPRKNGQVYNASKRVKWQSVDYRYDSFNSVVEISWGNRLLSSDYIEATYPHTSYCQDVVSLNLNPRYNPRIMNHIYITYLKPGTGKKVEWVELILDTENTYRITRYSGELPLPIGSLISIDYENSTFVSESEGVDGSEIGTYLILDMFQFTNPLSSSKAYLKDIRLKNGLSLDKELEILKKNPLLWQFKEFSEKNIEYSDKFFSIVAIDADEVLAPKEQHREILEKLVPIGHGLYIEYPEEQVEIVKAVSAYEDQIDVTIYSRLGSSVYSLGLTELGMPINLEEDLIITSPSILLEEGRELTLRFNVADIVNLAACYLIVSENEKILTSNIFYIKVRNEI